MNEDDIKTDENTQSDNSFEQALIDSAEAIDRKMGPGRIKLLKESYAFFRECGLDDDAIKSAMALTSFEMQLIKKP
jgi:hypothetical protein